MNNVILQLLRLYIKGPLVVRMNTMIRFPRNRKKSVESEIDWQNYKQTNKQKNVDESYAVMLLSLSLSLTLNL